MSIKDILGECVEVIFPEKGIMLTRWRRLDDPNIDYKDAQEYMLGKLEISRS